MNRALMILAFAATMATACSQNNPATKIKAAMKLNAGIVTSKLAESKAFYANNLGFGVTFENEFYLLMHTREKQAEISFLLPEHPTQQSLFHKPFQGQGMYLTIEVEDVDKMYRALKRKGVPIKIELRDEPWGDRHFAIEDPNGIAIDIVKYSPVQENK
jgi:catechol 2,3-dioxygenase-like lactoylglutathione lyase family enzyme